MDIESRLVEHRGRELIVRRDFDLDKIKIGALQR
jgi:hypothetical protein